MNEQKNQRKHVWAPSTLMLTLLQDPPISRHLVGETAMPTLRRSWQGLRLPSSHFRRATIPGQSKGRSRHLDNFPWTRWVDTRAVHTGEPSPNEKSRIWHPDQPDTWLFFYVRASVSLKCPISRTIPTPQSLSPRIGNKAMYVGGNLLHLVFANFAAFGDNAVRVKVDLSQPQLCVCVCVVVVVVGGIQLS